MTSKIRHFSIQLFVALLSRIACLRISGYVSMVGVGNPDFVMTAARPGATWRGTWRWRRAAAVRYVSLYNVITRFFVHYSQVPPMISSINDDYYNLPLMSTLLSCILTNRELKGKLLVILTVILLQLLYVFSCQSPCKYKLTIITMKIITPQYLTYPDVM